jgi:hypothetical protein
MMNSLLFSVNSCSIATRTRVCSTPPYPLTFNEGNDMIPPRVNVDVVRKSIGTYARAIA